MTYRFHDILTFASLMYDLKFTMAPSSSPMRKMDAPKT
jgi:hypothetical protein